MRWFSVMTLLACLGCSANGQDISLPQPVKTGGMPLLDALSKRASCREFSVRKPDLQTLSNLLWAACGINREDGRRTVPSALNMQETSVYVMLETGVYRYDETKNLLILVHAGDHRRLTGSQEYTHAVPVTLFFVADLDMLKISNPAEEHKMAYANASAGFIGQNVYLFAAANGMAAVFRASIDREELAKCFRLSPSQRVLYAQSVGYPEAR
ncbi:MAG: SagB/ThcOx family dehydrogenase [Planctomycetia bacterium]|nr:SagB/ThcOx family dehydrogenase [Planctomycetia bacterium]